MQLINLMKIYYTKYSIKMVIIYMFINKDK